MAKIGKEALIAKVSDKTGYTKKDVAEITNAILNTIGETLQAGDTVTIPGFGSFRVTRAKAHDGIDPRTKEKIRIPAGNRVHFTSGAPLKKLVNTKPSKKKGKVDLTKKK